MKAKKEEKIEEIETLNQIQDQIKDEEEYQNLVGDLRS